MNIQRVFLTTICCLFAVSIASAQTLSDTERQVVAWIDAHNDESVSFLEQVVDVNSGTENHEGVHEVGRLYAKAFEDIGMETTWEDLSPVNRSGNLWAEQKGSKGKRLLLIGHLDTVFPKDSPFQKFEMVNDSIAAGPGTEDMKGGDNVILFALKALHAVGALDDARIVVALTGDEEFTGQPFDISRGRFVEEAKNSDAALGFEGGVGSMNSATVARRGFTGWNLTVHGKRGHSSLIFRDQFGSGAIFEAARILNDWYKDLVGEKDLTFGAGIIVGGTTIEYDGELAKGSAFGKRNVIPQIVHVAGDLRTLSPAQTENAKERMQEIVARNLPETSAELVFDESFPAMAPTEGNWALLHKLDEINRTLGYGPIHAVDPAERGAADISFA
ncbi:MAG: M20/M25/M40 family metallo-hydrolase, partial [Rhodothermales bacterium]